MKLYEVSFLRSRFFSINLLCGFGCNAVAMTVLVLSVAFRICWMSSINYYVGLLTLHLLLFLNPLLIVKNVSDASLYYRYYFGE